MCGNSKPFMTRTTSKEMIQRTRLRNRFFKNPNAENEKSDNKQINLRVSCLRK